MADEQFFLYLQAYLLTGFMVALFIRLHDNEAMNLFEWFICIIAGIPFMVFFATHFVYEFLKKVKI